MRSFEFTRKKVGDSFTEEKAYENAQLPEYQTKNSAGADFFCAEEVTIPSLWRCINSASTGKAENTLCDKCFKPTLVHTGIKANMQDDEVLELYNRSSNPKKTGLIVANGVGVIDADYYGNKDNDGEILFSFYNFKPYDVTIKVGDRIGQGVFKKFLRPEEGLRVKSEERVGGLGSTDKR